MPTKFALSVCEVLSNRSTFSGYCVKLHLINSLSQHYDTSIDVIYESSLLSSSTEAARWERPRWAAACSAAARNDGPPRNTGTAAMAAAVEDQAVWRVPALAAQEPGISSNIGNCGLLLSKGINASGRDRVVPQHFALKMINICVLVETEGGD